jgi:hypothetical protein
VKKRKKREEKLTKDQFFRHVQLCFLQMPRSGKMFVEQSNLAMPSSVWLHVNGVSLATDIQPYEPPVHSYDYRTKHLQSPVQPPTPPMISPTAIVPYSITMIDGPYGISYSNKQQQKLENTDMSKKYFVDRHIKKAKSLAGLIKYEQNKTKQYSLMFLIDFLEVRLYLDILLFNPLHLRVQPYKTLRQIQYKTINYLPYMFIMMMIHSQYPTQMINIRLNLVVLEFTLLILIKFSSSRTMLRHLNNNNIKQLTIIHIVVIDVV